MEIDIEETAKKAKVLADLNVTDFLKKILESAKAWKEKLNVS